LVYTGKSLSPTLLWACTTCDDGSLAAMGSHFPRFLKTVRLLTLLEPRMWSILI
jgi:hypothetical protein